MRWRRVGWAIIAIFLIYMAMDDGAQFHERIGTSVKTLLHGEDADSGIRVAGFFPSYAWQLVFLPVFAAFGLFIVWFLNKELQSARDKRMVVVALGLLVLAVVADFFEGLDIDHSLNLHGWIMTTWDLSEYEVRHYSKSIEEFMEMLAMTLLWIVSCGTWCDSRPGSTCSFRIHERSHSNTDLSVAISYLVAVVVGQLTATGGQKETPPQE